MQTSTLICSLYHRSIPPNKETIKSIWDLGFQNIWIIDTGKNYLYEGPYSRFWSIGSTSYDAGMISFKKEEIPKNIERIVFLDNDAWLMNPQDFVDYLTIFITENYGLATFSTPNDWPLVRQQSANLIIPFKVQLLPLVSTGIGVPCRTYPHFENSYMIIRRDVWEKLTPEEVSHSRKMWPSIVEQEVKIGLRRCQYLNSTQYDPDCFLHVGNLMSSYYQYESKKPIVDKTRAGFFFKYLQSPVIPDGITRDECLEAWETLESLARSK